MSDPYLLAAGLLTIGPISALPPPALIPSLPDNLTALLANTAAQALRIGTNRFVSTLEITIPEFSALPPRSEEPRLQAASDLVTSMLKPSTAQAATELLSDQPLPALQEKVAVALSGGQLYLQRLAALRAGKVYTRLSTDGFQSVWAKPSNREAVASQQPTHRQWQRLLQQEAKAVAKGQGTNRLSVLLGDSLSLWFPSEKLPQGQFWLNQGISGENSHQILNRLSAFAETRPDTIYVMGGINDLRQGATNQVILENLRQIVRRSHLAHPQAQVIVQSILPTRLGAISPQRVRNLNQEIAVMAQQEGAGYLSLHTLFADEQGQLRQDLTTDGIHLSPLGYEVWQEALNYAESVIAANGQN